MNPPWGWRWGWGHLPPAQPVTHTTSAGWMEGRGVIHAASGILASPALWLCHPQEPQFPLASLHPASRGEEKVLVAQSCLTLCDPQDSSPPGSSVHGILQARILEWVAISSPGDLLDPEIEPGSPALQMESLPSEPPGKPYL